MRVCMLAYSFYENDMRILRYANTLADRGDEVDVIALQREGRASFEVIHGVRVYRIQPRKRNERGWFDYLIRVVRFIFASAFVLARKHLQQPYDVIHVHSVPDFLTFAAIVPKLLGAKIILDIHDILPEFFASKFAAKESSVKFKLLLLAEYLSIGFSDHVIIANDLWYERLIHRAVDASKCTAIINYPDASLFYPRDVPPVDGAFRITYPGTLNSHQGVDIAIRAVASLMGEIPELEFHIYGEGPEKPSLEKLSIDLGATDFVFFHDFLPCSQIVGEMALSTLCVVPKRASSPFGNEAMSTKIMEFMSLGVPVIVSNTKVDCYYHDDSRVRFFKSDDYADLAAAIRELHNKPDLRASLARNAQEYVRAHCWETKSAVYLHLVDALSSPGLPHDSSVEHRTT
jgi:glycosyltransferase involved in cell wall biosynthesis